MSSSFLERSLWKARPLKGPHHFGMRDKSQNPPRKCPDCQSKMSDALFIGSFGPIIVECTSNCGVYFQWQDPWTKHHYLSLWRLE